MFFVPEMMKERVEKMQVIIVFMVFGDDIPVTCFPDIVQSTCLSVIHQFIPMGIQEF